MTTDGQAVSIVRDTSQIVKEQQLDHATSLVQYNAAGHCLVIGEAEQALAATTNQGFDSVTVVQINTSLTTHQKQLTDQGTAVFSVPALQLDGYLGAFRAVVPATAISADSDFDIAVSVYLESGFFDVVLDLSSAPLLTMHLPPFGYQWADSPQHIAAAVDTLLQMKGEFDKPRYFDYDASLCAHSRSKLDGCSRCLDVCSTGAIVSAGEGIEVDPYLCQGCGSCATLCPSGAMRYAYPQPADAIARSRQALKDKDACVLLLHTESHQALIDKASLHNKIVPMLVEEVSAFGIDYWLALLAGRACRIALLVEDVPENPDYQALQSQIELVNALMAGLSVNESPVSLVHSDALANGTPECLQAEHFERSALYNVAGPEFATHNNKRQTIRMALDALLETFSAEQQAVSLPTDAPFGRVNVDTEACTLCMACASTCPAGALLDGQGTPALRFVESNCLQCGLCEQACPESAISLEARYRWDSVSARKIEQLHQDEPFHCLMCHEPFTTTSMIRTMSAKLTSHWMFQDEKSVRRLRLCADCRVKDMFRDDTAGIDVHK